MKLSLVVGLFAFLVFIGTVRATTYDCGGGCRSCQVAIDGASSNDIINITSDITEDSELYCDSEHYSYYECLDINMDNLTIEGNNYTWALGFDCGTGIIVNGNGTTLKNIHFNWSAGYAPGLIPSYYAICQERFTLPDMGFILNSNGNSIENVVFDRCTGLDLQSNADNNVVKGSFFYENISFVSSATGNLLYNNLFNNTQYVIGTLDSSNKWNETMIVGINVIGGSYIGGNYWAYPNGTGFSQVCNVTVTDGICDDSFSLDGSNTDYLPLSFASPAPPLPPAELSGMALTLSDAGTGLGGFLDSITNPLTQFILALGFVGGIFLIVFGFVRAFNFMGSMLG